MAIGIQKTHPQWYYNHVYVNTEKYQSFPLTNRKAFQFPCQRTFYLTRSCTFSINTLKNISKWQRWEPEIWKQRKSLQLRKIESKRKDQSFHRQSQHGGCECNKLWLVCPRLTCTSKQPCQVTGTQRKNQTPAEMGAELHWGRANRGEWWFLCLCLWDRQRQRKRCFWVWLGKTRALLCFTRGFCLNWCAWINKEFPEERTWTRLICLWDFNSLKWEKSVKYVSTY